MLLDVQVIANCNIFTASVNIRAPGSLASSNLVPRLSSASVFDRLQFAKASSRKGLITRLRLPGYKVTSSPTNQIGPISAHGWCSGNQCFKNAASQTGGLGMRLIELVASKRRCTNASSEFHKLSPGIQNAFSKLYPGCSRSWNHHNTSAVLPLIVFGTILTFQEPRQCPPGLCPILSLSPCTSAAWVHRQDRHVSEEISTKDNALSMLYLTTPLLGSWWRLYGGRKSIDYLRLHS